jgi:hypothetical protein
MPTITLRGSTEDPVWVLAVMLFPNDTRLREQYFSMQLAHAQTSDLKEDSQITVDVRTVRLLLDAPAWNDMKEIVAEARKRAIYAGYILESVYLMHRFQNLVPSFARPSVRKAIAMCEQFGLMHRFGDGTKMSYSPQKIRDCWEEFKPVAHLWAAFEINQAYAFLPVGEEFSSNEALNLFLGVAAGIFEFGSTFVPKATKPALPILDVTKSWLVPVTVQARHLYSDRVPDSLAAAAANYRSK